MKINKPFVGNRQRLTANLPKFLPAICLVLMTFEFLYYVIILYIFTIGFNVSSKIDFANNKHKLTLPIFANSVVWYKNLVIIKSRVKFFEA